MRSALWLVGVLAFLGCSKSSETEKPPTAPAAEWDLAPDGAAFGMVVKAGSLEHARSVLAATGADAEAQGLGDLVKEVHRELDHELDGADFSAAATWSERGLDLGKPFALFVMPRAAGADKPRTFMLVPLGDRAKFRTFAKARVEKDGADEVDVIKDKVYCLLLDARYLCARTVADVRLMAKKHDAPLAKVVRGLAADQRGDLTLYADLARFPEAKDELAAVGEYWGEIKQVGLAGSILADGLSVKLWAKGSFSGLASNVFQKDVKVSEVMKHATAGASSVLRVFITPGLLTMRMPATVPLPGTDLDLRKSVMDQLTGEMQLTTGGPGPYAAALRLGIKDPAVVSPVIDAGCKLAAQAAAEEHAPVTITPGPSTCSASFDPKTLQPELALPPITAKLSVIKGAALVLELGTPTPASGSVAALAATPETRAMLDDPAALLAWVRDFSVPLELLPPDMLKQLEGQKEVATGLALFSWLQLRVAEAGLSFTLAPETAAVNLRLVTFDGDPADAIAAYAAARKQSGDARKQAMIEIAKKYGATRTGRRAQLEVDGAGGLTSPVGSMMGSGLMFFASRRKAMEAPIVEDAPPQK